MMMISFLLQLVVICCKISRSSGYVIPMSVKIKAGRFKGAPGFFRGSPHSPA